MLLLSFVLFTLQTLRAKMHTNMHVLPQAHPCVP